MGVVIETFIKYPEAPAPYLNEGDWCWCPPLTGPIYIIYNTLV